jgi:two-component system sensor histidine kinase PhoQ
MVPGWTAWCYLLIPEGNKKLVVSNLSLRNRLLIAATLTLVAFLGLAGVALDRAFTTSARETVKDQLKTQINTLLTVVEVDDGGMLVVPDRLPESRLTSPNSGLYAVILDGDGEVLWRSNSSIGIELEFLQVAEPGQESFFQVRGQFDNSFYYSFGITWEIETGKEVELTFAMINESRAYEQIVRSHRNELFFWLGITGVLLLLMQAISLHWGLRPLGEVTRELDLIENSKQHKILGKYPWEIAQLSKRINLFIENERKNLERYRNTLGDLAHSLKTPLAVIRGIAEKQGEIDRENIREHVERMNKIVEYQLERAAPSQISTMHSTVDIEQVLGKLDDSLQKVYAEKNISSEWDIDPRSFFIGDESDLFELLGNVMDNAYKWARSKVQYRTNVESSGENMPHGITIEIHDDGPGIEKSERTAVLRRGTRADQQTPGQGIGLAVSREVIDRYDGSLIIGNSKLGGTLVSMYFSSI